MDRKSVALVTLIFFTLFSCQPYITKVVKTSEISTQESESIKVLGLVTTANKWIEFETEPGRIVSNAIVGEVVDESGKGLKRVSIPLSEVNRQYRLLVVNEVDKADYLDHLLLLAVDHPPQVYA
jgi:hypothetical protein